MKQRSVVYRWVAVMGIAVLVLGAMMRFQSAQAQERDAFQQGQPPAPGFPQPPGGGFGGGGGFAGGRPMMGPMGGGSAIAVSGDSVYVIQGNSLFKFAANDLRLVKRVQLEMGPPPGGPGGPGFEGGPRRPGGEGERRRDGDRKDGERGER